MYRIRVQFDVPPLLTTSFRAFSVARVPQNNHIVHQVYLVIYISTITQYTYSALYTNL